MQGKLSSIQISGFLTALRAKGESPTEIAGAAEALREQATDFPRPDYPYVDTCGTGGDGASTLNISTAVAVVSAGMGIPVAKHGNRSVSSKCGSADVLEQVGGQLEVSPQTARRCLDEAGFCFLFAPQYHAGVRHAMPVRNDLGVRTVFNLLGPLVNPAEPAYQLMGVYEPGLVEPIAETLGLLGCREAFVVHGSGVDEVAIHGPTRIAHLDGDEVSVFEVEPEDAGLKRYELDALRGGDPEYNAEAFEALLRGEGRPAYRASVALNAGALAKLTGRAETIEEGTRRAVELIDSGQLVDRVNQFVEVTNGTR